MERLICFLIGYAFGLIQTAYLVGRARGIDIRKTGSGNSGTTNALRTFGLKLGLLTMVVDVVKCIAAVLVVWLIFRSRRADILPLLKLYAAAGAVIGHVFPITMGFRGGKGIAASVGMILAFLDWRLILVCAICFIGLFILTHLVSLCSLTLMAAFFVGLTIFCLRGDYGMTGRQRAELIVVAAVLTAIAFLGHRENIRRLAAGIERKTYLGSARQAKATAEYERKLKQREEKKNG